MKVIVTGASGTASLLSPRSLSLQAYSLTRSQDYSAGRSMLRWSEQDIRVGQPIFESHEPDQLIATVLQSLGLRSAVLAKAWSRSVPLPPHALAVAALNLHSSARVRWISSTRTRSSSSSSQSSRMVSHLYS